VFSAKPKLYRHRRAATSIFILRRVLVVESLTILTHITFAPARLAAYRAASKRRHTGPDGGMSMKASDYSCIPLCAECHTLRPDSYHRHPGGRAGFTRQFGLDRAELAARLNTEWRKREKLCLIKNQMGVS
jgi:hypothetical protein